MSITTRAKALIAAATTTSRPVWAFLAAEAIAVTGVAVVVCGTGAALAGAVALDQLPPWRALLVFPAVGAAAHLLRAAEAVQALRRWHGVAVRRIDERWGDDR
jgi:hypothetical protein